MKKDINMKLPGLRSAVDLMGLVSSDAWDITDRLV